MIADFEQRFADVLGTRLPAPFGGRVVVSPGAAVAPPMVTVGVRHFDRIDEAFGNRPERVPGSGDPRRVARLRCSVGLTVVGAVDRGAALRGVDDVLFAVDAPDFRDGSALRVELGDPGFLIDALTLESGDLAPDGAPTPTEVAVTAQGWFWPVGTPGETGIAIGEIRVRGAVLPLELQPTTGTIAAGSAAQELALRVRAAGLLRLGSTAALPFGQLVLQLFAPGRRPGAGTLEGGAAGTAAGSRLVTIADGVAPFRYLPPATAARDELVVALDDGEGGPGIELGKFTFTVKGA